MKLIFSMINRSLAKCRMILLSCVVTEANAEYLGQEKQPTQDQERDFIY